MKIYVASSWKNPYQQDIVARLRKRGYTVYDYMHPPESTGFGWSEVGTSQIEEDPQAFLRGLNHPRALEGFESDFGAMLAADVGVLVLPCGRSAHTEAGWMAGRGKPVCALLLERPIVSELMYLIFDRIVLTIDETLKWTAEQDIH
jgi:hypothetical protein